MRYVVKVKPGSKKGPLVELSEDGLIVVFVREPAVDGKANTALIKLLSEYFAVPKTRITVARGHTTRQKIIDVSDK